jgi:ADP-ribosylglycohydrolase
MSGSRLFDKIYGSLAASAVGAAMGWITEGWPLDRIEREFRVLESLPKHPAIRAGRLYWLNGPFLDFGAWDPPAGATEDGIERQHLVTTAIIKKQGRITARELAETWLAEIDPAHFGYQLGVHDRIFYHLLQGGIEPALAGLQTPWPGLVDVDMMIHPIGLVNACNPEQAARDAREVARIMQSPIGWGLDCAAAVAAATAEAVRPEATVDSVVSAALEEAQPSLRAEWEGALEIARRHRDWKEMRQEFHRRYAGLPAFFGHEVAAEALALLLVCEGSPREVIVAGANFGRDTDCIACVAGGIAGALRGAGELPPEWIETVDAATRASPYSVARGRSIRQAAEGIHSALFAEIGRAEAQAAAVRGLSQEA